MLATKRPFKKVTSQKDANGTAITRIVCESCNENTDDHILVGDSCYYACSRCGVCHWYESSGDTLRIWYDMSPEDQDKEKDKLDAYREV